MTVLERFAAGRLLHNGGEPEVVASFPGGHVWPPVADSARSLRRVRRLASAGIAILGLTDLISAVVPPQVRGRLHPLLGYIPLGVSEAAGASSRWPASDYWRSPAASDGASAWRGSSRSGSSPARSRYT